MTMLNTHTHTLATRFIALLALSALSLVAFACADDDGGNTTAADTSSSGTDTSTQPDSGDDTSTQPDSGDDTSTQPDGDDTSTQPDGDDTSTQPDGDDTSDTDVIVPIDYTGLVINEVAAAGDPTDWVELYNGTSRDLDLGVLRISDSRDTEGALLPAGAAVAAGNYFLIYLESGGFPGFQLGGDEEVALFSPDGTVIDLVDWAEGQSPIDATFGRFPNGTGDFKTLSTPTPGYANEDNAAGAVCGDGLVQGDEGCDDQDTGEGDGCDAACAVEDGWACTQAPSLCVTTCGDGVVAGAEECDDANTVAGDGCSTTCTWEPASSGGVVINEVVHKAINNGVDWVELYNTSDQPIDISAWTLTDDTPATNRYAFPADTIIAPDTYLLIDRDVFLFGLSADDAVMLFNTADERVDFADWLDGDAPEGSSYGRFPDGTGDFGTLATPTPGAANTQ
jgi:cysteine-rich repeat protein